MGGDPTKAEDRVERIDVAAFVNLTISVRFGAKDFSATNEAIAQVCGVTEKTVRMWRDGRKPIPLWAILRLPKWLGDAILDELRERLHTGERLHGLRREAKRLAGQDLSPAERLEVFDLMGGIGAKR